MKFLKIIITVTMLVFSASIFAQDKAVYNIDDSSIALQGYSPVSYLDLGLAQRGVKDFKSTYNDVVYYFTSAEQKSTFDKNPEKYLPQYGGYCAYGVYIGAKFRVDPNKFIVKDGKYFLYLYNLEVDAEQKWLAENNHNRLVATANANWKKLSRMYK
jgi:YHS domain-containing protein